MEALTHDAIVVGGGVGGLAAAFRLRQRRPDWRIAVVEAAPRWGGVVSSSRRDGCVLEHGPDSLIRTKPEGMRLIDDLGLRARVQDTDPRFRGALVARGPRLVPIPEGLYLLAPGRWLPFLRSPILSWPGKLRVGLDLLLPRGPAARGEDESLASFVRRRLGREALERIAQPMVGGIYTADPERLSLPFTMPQFAEMERGHRSLLLAMRARARAQAAAGGAHGARYGLFASLEGGLQTLTDALVARLEGCDLRLGACAEGLAWRDGAWRLAAPALAAPRLCLCLPAWSAAGLLGSAANELAVELASVPYAGVATVNLAFSRAAAPALPAAAGFVVPAVERRSLVAATFCHQKYPGRCPDDLVVLRAFVGGALHEDRLAAGDEAMVDGLLADLRDLLGLRAPPRWTQVSRWPAAMAQPVVGHGVRLARIRAAERALPGLALVGNGYEGVGVPDICAQAALAAERLAGG